MKPTAYRSSMDFFDAQARAKKRTSRLVVLFALAVIGTVAASYFAAIIGLRQVAERREHQFDRRGVYVHTVSSSPWWQPKLFLGVSSTVLAIIGLASLAKWKQFSAGGSAVAESIGGRRVDPHTANPNERRLLNVVEEMAIASGVPVPAIYVLDDEPAINAFAAGLTTSDAVVAVTRGTIEKLNRDELQAVVGHEFSHILNGDMRLNLRLTALLFGILVLGLAGRGVLWGMRHASVGRSRKNSGGILVAILFAGLALMIIGYVGYFFGRIIQAAVSRQREFLADAAAVQFTRNPLGLSGALKKIGGYALGSRLQTSKAAAIGHFFFAQSFRSGITGLWSTHPPLEERIRAIDPQFDGAMFEPREVVNVEAESFVSAGLTPAKPQPSPAQLQAFSAAAAIASIGTLTPEQVAAAESLLAAVPARLRDAAHSSADVATLLFGLLLDAEPSVRQQQRSLVAEHAGESALAALDHFAPELGQIGAQHRLPLVQLALPTLRSLSAAEMPVLLRTVNHLVRADGCVSPFEFALEKLLTRSVALERKPTGATVQFYSFRAVTDEIAAVLSALAHSSTTDATEARAAFATGANQLKLIEPLLLFQPSPCDFATLDQALGKLAETSLPIKRRTLLACAYVVSANGSVSVEEAEMLRAFAATLDCPMPPLS